MSSADPATLGDLRPVRLLGLPLALHQRSREHHEELLREFSLIANPHPDSEPHVPQRLADIIATLRRRYSPFLAAPDADRQAALDRGDTSVDLDYLLPASARDAFLRLSQLLEEVEDYCRQGELLTLATPPDLLAFRQWYLGEFVAQMDGRPATPWPVVERRAREARR